jgi:hypothetical protein
MSEPLNATSTPAYVGVIVELDGLPHLDFGSPDGPWRRHRSSASTSAGDRSLLTAAAATAAIAAAAALLLPLVWLIQVINL